MTETPEQKAAIAKLNSELSGLRAAQIQQLQYIMDLGEHITKLTVRLAELQRDLYHWLMQGGDQCGAVDAAVSVNR